MTKFKLGFNLISAGNRFPEPEEWARITRQEFDLDFIQFSTDVLDPFWPESYVNAYIARTKTALEKYGLIVESIFSGVFSRRHLLLHPDPEGRAIWMEWYRALIRIGAALGARGIGSPFGTLTMKDFKDPQLHNERVSEAILGWQALSRYAEEMGMAYLFFETMSIPREMADTIADAKSLYERLNENSAVPVQMCLDVGHAPHPTERDPYRWLRELSQYTCCVHLQQTEANHSRHWPFIPEFNAIGIIDPERVLSSIEESGVEEMSLFFEIMHRESHEQDGRVLPDIRQSVEYWRNFFAQRDEVRLS